MPCGQSHIENPAVVRFCDQRSLCRETLALAASRACTRSGGPDAACTVDDQETHRS